MAEEKKAIDYSDLEKKLEELDATAFQRAERACRQSADPTPDIVYSGPFRARLAAEALGVPYEEIRATNLKTYTAIVERTLNFLLQSLGEEVLKRNV